ncbi:hypothetical protein [Blattabacterium cuenoti]|uniref:hypothetical protein n=1 Tax=Blattabacterium cuenoti TaxID=1653831 RepID=UPI00163BBB59|nr:hypothetical protein [Blattabacterium cuenoti]
MKKKKNLHYAIIRYGRSFSVFPVLVFVLISEKEKSLKKIKTINLIGTLVKKKVSESRS